MGKRKKGKEETVASDDVVEEINGGRAGGEPRNRVKRNERKRKETKRKGGGWGRRCETTDYKPRGV